MKSDGGKVVRLSEYGYRGLLVQLILNGYSCADPQERLKLAHRRRLAQLKKYQQYEKDLGSKKNKLLHSEQQRRARAKNGPRVRFRNNIMLLEAAGRNDVDEGELYSYNLLQPILSHKNLVFTLPVCL